MPGNRCSVAVCSNSFYKTKGLEGSSSISYFRFPSDPRLRKIWIEACKRKDDWNPNNAFICSIHFTEDDFERNLMAEMNFARKKRSLKPGSIPTKYLLPSHSTIPKSPSARSKRRKTKEKREMVRALIEDETSVDKDPEDNVQPISTEENIQEKYNSLLEKYENLLQEHSSLKAMYEEKVKALEVEVNERETLVDVRVRQVLHKYLTDGQISLLLSGKKQVKSWTPEEMGMAFAIRYLSKRCYIYLRKQLNFPLPGISTLQRWASSIDMRQGLLKDVIHIMKVAAMNLKEIEKVAVILFDEMKVEEVYELDKTADEVVGPHKQMQVVMARGLFSQWKQPIFVDFDQRMTKEILNHIIASLSEVGYTVVATACDCAGSNLGLLKELGVSYEKTWFLSNQRKVYCFCDAPHLLKLLRNHFLDSGFSLEGGEVISCRPVRELISKTGTEISSLFKLSPSHVNCEKQARQNVRLAAQLLSHTTATALRHYDIGEKEERLNAATFIEKINMWFDLVNSYIPGEGQYFQCAFGVNLEAQVSFLEEFFLW